MPLVQYILKVCILEGHKDIAPVFQGRFQVTDHQGCPAHSE